VLRAVESFIAFGLREHIFKKSAKVICGLKRPRG